MRILFLRMAALLFFSSTMALAQPIQFQGSNSAKTALAQNTDFLKPVEVIIEFVDPPMSAQPRKGQTAASALSVSLTRRQQLSLDLRQIQSAISNRFNIDLPVAEMSRSFYKVFNGLCVRVPSAAITSISRLPYVKRVHFDSEVKAHLVDSVPLIRADRVWQEFGTQGEGVVVGIIDTGIDYMHPALGGGFGPNFQVIGGYDVINDDSDPMDDNNHGTHVAGIVAASGAGLTGVAPKVKLMAFKVLGANGSGPTSVVIAGIERAVDPNDDGDFSDRVDIVNMSLGGEGNADDARSVAVDNAVALGVTFCVSAGNLGAFSAIGSPGTARSAITVGATTKADEIATFSSKGPNPIIFSIKPDVVAPGVAITSSIRGGQTASFNGTSMSTPHVAGIAALLKSLHPEWSPARIKSAIVNTAVDLGDHVMAQGAGRVDAFSAVSARAYCEPVQLNFGFANDGVSSWQTHATLTVTNERATMQTFTASGAAGTGIEIQTTPNPFNLAPGQSQEIEVDLTVNNSLVPYLQIDSPLSYGGILFIVGSADTLRVPWAFNKTHQLVLISDENIGEYYLTGGSLTESGGGRPLMTNPYLYQEIIPSGLYDLLAILPEAGRIYMKEQFTIQGSDTVHITAADTPNLVEFRGVDENGTLLSSLPNKVTYIHWEDPLIPKFNYNIRFLIDNPPSYTQRDFFTPILFWSDSLWASNISNRFTFYAAETYHDLESRKQIYVAQHAPFTGVSGNVRLENQPADYIARDLSVGMPLKHARLKVPALEVLLTWHFSLGGAPDRVGVGLTAGRYLSESGNWHATLFHTQDQLPTRGLAAVIRGLTDTTRAAVGTPYFLSDPFRRSANRLGSFPDNAPSPAIYFPEPGTAMNFGDTPSYPLVEYDDLQGSDIIALPKFYGALGETRWLNLLLTRYAVYDAATDSLLAQGDFMDPTGTQIQAPGILYPNAPLAEYRLEFATSGHYVDAIQSDAKVTAFFDTRRSDPTPPTMTSFKLLNSAGVPVGRLEPGEMATIEFSGADYASNRTYNPVEPDSTRLYIREWGTQNWLPQNGEVILHDSFEGNGYRPVGYIFRAQLQDHLSFDSTAVDIKVHLRDRRGNSSDWVLAPAFSIGEFVVSVEDDSVETTNALPTKFELYANYPNPFNPTTTIRYDLPQPTQVRLRIYNILGQSIATLVDQVQAAGRRIVTWDGTDQRGATVASGVYIYALETPTFRRAHKLLLIR